MATTCFFLSEKQTNQSLIEFDLTESIELILLVLHYCVIFYTIVSSYQIKKVRLINPPEQLLTLADLVNLSHWISTFIDHN